MDCLVSVDDTWQKRGHQSLLGAVYVIEYRTGKVLDYNIVFCKFCHNATCIRMEQRYCRFPGVEGIS